MANTVIQMPQLGESVAEGTIGRWLKQPGDRVERDEPLVEIQTDKVNAEVPSPVAGILQQILLPEGTTAAVKSDMAIIGDEQITGLDAQPQAAPPPMSPPPRSAPTQPSAAAPAAGSGIAPAGPSGTPPPTTASVAANPDGPPLAPTPSGAPTQRGAPQGSAGTPAVGSGISPAGPSGTPPPPAATPVAANPDGLPLAPGGAPTQRGAAAPGPGSPAVARSFSYDQSAGGGVVGQRDDDAAPPTLPEARAAETAKRFYTPVVLRMAEEHALDLSTIQGTGGHGRVTRKDVEQAIAESRTAPTATPATPAAPAAPAASAAPAAPAASAAPAGPTAPALAPTVPAPAGSAPAALAPTAATPAGPTPAADLRSLGDDERPLSPMRRAIAAHMTRARADIPDAWSLTEIDMTNLVRHRARLQADWQAREGTELTYLPFFIKAVLAGLRAVPELNASFAGDRIVVHRQYHLGIAVSVEQGLLVPVLRNADQLSVAGVALAVRAMVQRARGGKLSLNELEGATFTVNNPGSLGSIMSQPIVPVGQTGIVTMEAIVKRPIVTADDAIAIRSMMNSCLSFDHRVLDGSGALKFLRTLKQELETVDYPLY